MVATMRVFQYLIISLIKKLDLKLAVSNIKPNIETIVSKKEA
jgi:hypothetical protein